MRSIENAGWQKTFFLVWIGQAFSILGSELVQFSLVWYLTRETGSAAVLAFASFVALIPRVVLNPIAGALVDRWNRQHVMIFADAGIALVTMLMAVLFWLGEVSLWHIYAILFLRALGGGFHWPAMQASTSLMVPKEHLARISGLNQTLRGALGVTAPVFAALLIESIPLFGILSIDVITAIIAISPLLFVVIPQPVSNNSTGVSPDKLFDDVRAGLKYMFKWKGLLYLALSATILNFLLSPGYTFTPLLVRDHFNKGAIDLSFLESAFSGGMIIGGVVLSAWGGFKRNIYTTLAGILGLAVGTSLVAASQTDQFNMAVAGMALAGFMQPIANGPIFAIIQSKVAPEIQGRIFTLLESMVSAMMPISMIIAAPIAEWIGVRGWLVFGSIGCFVIGVSGFFIPALTNIENHEPLREELAPAIE